MGKFIAHAPCPDCGSTDNVAVWDDGAQCMSCDFKTRDEDTIELLLAHKVGGTTRMTPVSFTPPVLRPIAKTWRGISPETFARYGVGLDTSNNVHFPHYVSGVHVGSKVRSAVAKEFWFVGSSTDVQLFGMHCANGDRRIILTEAELDALSVTEMTGYPAVSVPFGTASAAKHVKATLRWLEKFDEVVLCFDADKPGQDAQLACLKLLAPGKVKSMVLPTGYKDANDMLVAGKAHEFKMAYYSAQSTLPVGVISRQETIDRVLAFNSDRNKRVGVTTGYDGLDALIGGFRAGDVITIAAGTGKFKSALSRNLVFRQAQRGVRALYIPLEDLTEVVWTRFCEMHMGEALLRTQQQPHPDSLRDALDALLDNVSILDHRGGMTVDELVNSISYVVREHDVKVVVLDHITAMANSVPGTDERKSLDVCIEALKMRVAVGLKCTVVVVTHLSRSTDDKDDNKPSLNRLKGASSIAQYSDCVLGLTVNKEDGVLTVEPLKRHRIWGGTEPFKLQWGQTSQQLEDVTETYRNAEIPQVEDTDGIRTGYEPAEEVQVVVRDDRVGHESTDRTQRRVRESEGTVPDEPHVHTRLATTERHSRGDERSAVSGGQKQDDTRTTAASRLSARIPLPAE